MQKIIVASTNQGKIKEIKALLGDKFDIVTMIDAGINIDIEETGTTFEENALIKAREINRLTGEYALSDDSGLCVDALGGAPGVYSARYCGTHGHDTQNNELLLKNMQGVQNRKAHFASCVVLVKSYNNYLVGYGEVEGIILEGIDGKNGFGYDPLFYSNELKKSFGVALADEKNKISHRARALNALLKQL